MEVSGKSFLGFIRALKEKGGGALLRQAIADMDEPTRAMFSKRILISGWYPYPAFLCSLGVTVRHLELDPPNELKKLGKLSANRDLSNIFAIFKLILRPERLIKSCGVFWHKYYRNAGDIEAIAWQPDHTIIRITDFPDMDPRHCEYVNGYMMGLMEEINFRMLTDQETMCQSRGDPYHEFLYSWTKA